MQQKEPLGANHGHAPLEGLYHCTCLATFTLLYAPHRIMVQAAEVLVKKKLLRPAEETPNLCKDDRHMLILLTYW